MITQIKPQQKHLKKIVFCLGLLVVLSLSLTFSLVRAQVSSKKVGVIVEYTSQDLRDPFKNPFEMIEMVEEPTEKPPIGYGLTHLQVQGMVWGSKMPQAIINNTVVKVGGVIEGAEILDIRREGVYVLYEGRQYILRSAIPKK